MNKFCYFPPLVSFISNWQNTMHSHVIFNKYISDTNPLKLGYIEIWGVGSVSVSGVSISVSGMVITPTFSYNSTTQVCDQWKVQMVFPNPELPRAVPSCFPSRWYPLLQSPSRIPLCSVCQRGQHGDEGKIQGLLSFGTDGLDPYLSCTSSCLQTYVKLCLCLRDLLLKQLELPYFINYKTPSVKICSFISRATKKEKVLQKYDSMLSYHLKLLF